MAIDSSSWREPRDASSSTTHAAAATPTRTRRQQGAPRLFRPLVVTRPAQIDEDSPVLNLDRIDGQIVATEHNPCAINPTIAPLKGYPPTIAVVSPTATWAKRGALGPLPG